MSSTTRRRTLGDVNSPNVLPEEPLTKVKRKPGPPPKAMGVKQKRVRSQEKSEFEQRREENLKANAAFLAALNMSETKNSLSKSVKTDKKPARKSAPASRGITVKREYEPMLQREYSLRPRGLLKNNTTSYDEDLLAAPPSTGLRDQTRRVPSSTKRGITGAAASASTVESANDYRRQNAAPELQFSDNQVNKETCDFDALSARFKSGMNVSSHVDNRPLDEFVQECKQMVISDDLMAKVTPDRIFSLAIHPSAHESPLIAAGDKSGHVGLWNVLQKSSSDERGGDDGVCLFRPHTRPVTCTLFSPTDLSTFHSASYDGTVRKCDINKQVFSLVHSTLNEDSVGMMYLSTVDTRTVAVCTSDGYVTYIDDRNHHQQQSSYKLYSDRCSKFKCISHHPTQRQYFITGSVQGKMELWDSRYISTKKESSPLQEFPTSAGVLSSYFSPLTGDKILTCESGNRISVFDSSDLTNLQLQKSFYHDNHTGRWISNFRAAWHPAREDSFVIGAMKHPRQVELYDCSGKLLHNYHDNEETLRSITSLNVFHPSQPVLAGANASGKVYVYMVPDMIDA